MSGTFAAKLLSFSFQRHGSISPPPVSDLDGRFPQDGVVLSVTLTHTEHPEVLHPVHLQPQLLVDTHTQTHTQLLTAASEHWRLIFKPCDPGYRLGLAQM